MDSSYGLRSFQQRKTMRSHLYASDRTAAWWDLFLSSRCAVSRCPVRVGNRLRGPLMEGLPQELRTTPSPMYPMLLTTGFGHRGNPTVLLDLGGVPIAVALGAKGSDQSRNQHLPGARQR